VAAATGGNSVKTEVVYLLRRRSAAERERLRILLDRANVPDDALIRRLNAKNFASGITAAEFSAARGRR
jgi:hypothetical protein